MNLTEFLTRFPKADMHYHLLGGVRPQTMLDFAKKYNHPLSEFDAHQFYRGLQSVNTGKGGIAALELLYTIMRHPDDYNRVMHEVAQDAIATGVRYIETFWNPSDVPNSDYKTFNDALITAIDEVEAQYGVTMRLIPAINRQKSPEEAVRMVQDMIDNPHSYVVGLGIDYQEKDASVEMFWKAYALAKKHGYKLTAHCSEFGLHWRNAEAGLDLIGVDRIDHGYSVIDNNDLMMRCVREKIPFTVIPSNTFFLRQWPDVEQWRKNHPIRTMAQAGMTIVPCTDDWHIHDTNGMVCYRTMVEDFGFDLDGIRQCMVNSINILWTDDKTKSKLMTEWTTEFDHLRTQLDSEPTIPSDMHIDYAKIYANI